MCVGALTSLAKTGGPSYVKRVFTIARKAHLKPVRAQYIRALKKLIWHKDYDDLSDAQIANAILLRGGDNLFREASARSKASKGLLVQGIIDIIAEDIRADR